MKSDHGCYSKAPKAFINLFLRRVIGVFWLGTMVKEGLHRGRGRYRCVDERAEVAADRPHIKEELQLHCWLSDTILGLSTSESL